MFLEQHCEFKQVEFTSFVNEKKFVENVYLCMPPLPFYNRADQPEQEKFKHACCMCTTQLDRQLTLLCFPVWKRELSFAVTAVVFWEFALLYARRGVRPTQFNASALD